jgi:predicted AAA+ superfamily ATPase
LPIVWQSEARRDTLEAYVLAYLREEVQAEALVRNLPGFARFLPIAALFHAQTLNTASLSRDAGVARTTVVGYLDILVDTLLAFTLPAYEARLRVRERKHPKLYWADAGVVRAIRKDLSPPGAEERGALFEGYIAQLLRAYGDYRRLFDEWFYWAPADAVATEVDFLLRRGRELVAIEVKSSKRVGNEQLKGLRAVGELRGLVRRLVVYLGAERARTDDGIELLPFADFARELAKDELC